MFFQLRPYITAELELSKGDTLLGHISEINESEIFFYATLRNDEVFNEILKIPVSELKQVRYCDINDIDDF